MGRKRKGKKDDEQERSRSGSVPATGRKAKKEKDLIDLEVRDLVLNVAESDNTDVPRRDRFAREVLVDYLQRNVESMYPHIGEETYRVPDIHINKGKEGEVNSDGVMEQVRPTDTDVRSDRAHSFVSDMVYELSLRFKTTKVGPFFMISSYEYDHFLSRLKTSIEEKIWPHDAEVPFPKGSGHDRGEIDILIILPKHVIFMEIKAIGDNFGEYNGDKTSPVRDNIKKATNQLFRDEKVFDHVMADLKLEGFKRTKIAAFPNLEWEFVEEAMKDDELKKKCQSMKFLCKKDMPRNRARFWEDFHLFKKWWINNVFPELGENEGTGIIDHKSTSQQTTEAQISTNQRTPLDEVKVIVGRYVGFLSVVTVCNNSGSKLNRVGGLIEGRRRGQLVWYVGERFANIVLTPDQKNYLDTDVKLGYLCGPPGSGKTVVLSVKARRWILNEENFVVIVNMYRGAAGRAIGKHMYKTITENTDSKRKEFLKSHTMEIGVDVSDLRFSREKFVQKITSRWNDIGDERERIMFIVDETYVQSYWNEVFQAIRVEFEKSIMWCAGLYGKQPEHFTSLELTKVIRCPPNVQSVLSRIDWVDSRQRHYITDSTEACLPTDGPKVLTIRHHEHVEYSHLTPSYCPLCGNDLVKILQLLHVETPGKCHTDPDLKIWSLNCSEVTILANLPRNRYRSDDRNYLDTTLTDYKDYMSSFKECPMINKLNEASYPTLVHTRLMSPALVSSSNHDVVNVTWIYTYQGLENKVIVFVPGDEAMPEDCSEEYLVDPLLNIPCPGLQGTEDEDLSEMGQDFMDDCKINEESNRNNSESESGSGEDEEASNDSDCSDNSDRSEFSEKRSTQSEQRHVGFSEIKRKCDNCPCSLRAENSDEENIDKKVKGHEKCDSFLESEDKSMEDYIFRITDIDRYTRWDKNNLVIAASRCTSQLIIITR